MSVTDRPYVGNWLPNKRTIVQYTPDALLYVNGDTSIPGCRTCHHNIELGRFVNAMSVETGVEPGASSCTISLSIPHHYGDSIFRDGNTLLKAGLEVHIYMRGYFPMKGLSTPGAAPVSGVNLGDIPQYPYYPVFHGVVTSVDDDYASGYYTASMTCSGMLHFWQFQKVSGAQGASFFGARPTNSRLQTTLTGHPFTGQTPYSIMYNLYRDTVGAAGGVGFALQSRTNFGAISTVTRDSLFGLTIRYWERRFRDRIYGLRMHGASGQMFTASQQAYLARAQPGHVLAANANIRVRGRNVHQDDRTLLLNLADRRGGRVLRQPDVNLLASADGGAFGLSLTQMQAFTTDVSAIGQANLWESTYESKMDIANQVTQVTGFEFYQDVDGDLVFKPPLYNLDTSSSRIYRIEPQDIINISFKNGEPESTYVVVKAGPFQNTTGLVDAEEWGVRSVYVDYKLVAQFGWREHSIETSYYNNARSTFFAGVAQLDRINAATNSCSITIPIRPEIRPGFPVYISHVDCFYYVQSISHSFNFTGECTTTLNLIARRRKFFAPGTASTTDASTQGVNGIKLADTYLPQKPLQALTPDYVPRLVGFPNVVMALDPDRINPLFYVYGFQAEDSTLSSGGARRQGENRDIFLTGLLQALWSNGLIIPAQPADDAAISNLRNDNDTNWFANTANVTWAVLAGNPPTTGSPASSSNNNRLTVSSGEIRLTYSDFRAALGNYISIRDASRSVLPDLSRNLSHLRQSLVEAQAAQPSDPAAVASAQQAVNACVQSIQNVQANFSPSSTYNSYESTQTQIDGSIQAISAPVTGATHRRSQTAVSNLSGGQRQNVAVFAFLMNQLRTQGLPGMTRDSNYDPTGLVNDSSNILELLADRKASMSVNVPGYYRYYSASHPDPAQQGYESISNPSTSTSVPRNDTPTPLSDGATSLSRVPPTAPPIARPHRGQRGASLAEQYRSTGRVVTRQNTALTPPQIAAYIRQAWNNHYNSDPPDSVLAILLAQSLHESTAAGGSGPGGSMYNFNFGGVRPSFHWQGVVFNSPVHGENIYYRAYGSAAEGAQDFVNNLINNHGEAIQQAVSSGDATAYVQALNNYAVGDPAHYAQDVAVWVRQINRSGWIDQSRTIGPSQEETITQEYADATPEEQNQTVKVVPVTGADVGNTTIDITDVIKLEPTVPTRGLRVRTNASSSPQVVSTNNIFALSFEERIVTRIANTPIVSIRQGTTPQEAIAFFQSCLSGNQTFINALASTFVTAAAASITNTTQTGGALVSSVVGTIHGLTAGVSNGTPIAASSTITDIANGSPNNHAVLNGNDVTNVAVGSADNARSILSEKARALISQVSSANSAALNQAITYLQSDPPNPSGASGAIQPWITSITNLFLGRGLPGRLPFTTETGLHAIRTPLNTFSPVFPVSDAHGYEHYGSYQYGRGVSIEPGGNYQRLMAQDPFEFADPEALDAFIRRLIRSNVRGPNGQFILSPELQRSLTQIVTGEGFQNSLGAEIALRWNENSPNGASGDNRTAMLANGMANYVLSDRDVVTRLPVSNIAYQLTDLTPQGQVDVCQCRGAESDLLMAAYMVGSGPQSFVAIDGSDAAVSYVKNLMVQNAETWSLAQSAMRGLSIAAGRRSTLDGFLGIINGAVSGTQQAATSSSALLNQSVSNFNSALNRVG